MQELIDGKQAWPIYDFIAILCLVFCLSFMPEAWGQAPSECAAPHYPSTYGWVNIEIHEAVFNGAASLNGLRIGDYLEAVWGPSQGDVRCSGSHRIAVQLWKGVPIKHRVAAMVSSPHFPEVQLSMPEQGQVHLRVRRIDSFGDFRYWAVTALAEGRGKSPWTYSVSGSPWPTDSLLIIKMQVYPINSAAPLADASAVIFLPPHPNPATNTITIGRAFVMYNVLGRRVMEGGGGTYDVSALAAGIYIVAYLDEGESTAITIL